MHGGVLVQVATRLSDPSRVRRDHYAVACPDISLAFELVRAERQVTGDQRLVMAGRLPASFMAAICMQSGEVRSLGCGPLEVYPCAAEHHGLAAAPELMSREQPVRQRASARRLVAV